MKIALLADPIDSQKAGIHVYVRELIYALDKSKSKNEYFILRVEADDKIKSLTQVALGPIGNSLQRLKRLLLTIPRKCIELDVDVVIELAHMGPFNLPNSIKRVTVVHDLTPLLFPQWHNGLSATTQRLVLPKILNNADIIIANSENTAADIINLNNANLDKVHTIYPGINPVFQPTHERKELDRLGIGSNYFHFVGTIEPRKNLTVLLKAYEEFRENSLTEIQLVIVGQKGWKNSEFYSQLDLHPFRKDIFLTGYVSIKAMCQIHSHSLALIFPSLYEGFGFPILEAMACGCHVISANNSSLPELGGTLSTYFNSNDHFELAKLLETQNTTSTTEDTKKKAIKHTLQFSWEMFIRNFEKLLDSTHSATR